MKHHLLFILILFGLLSQGCEPEITFKEPQPAGLSNLKIFPKRIQGKYANAEGNVQVEVGEKLILETCNYTIKVSKNKTDSLYRISGDTIIGLKDNIKAPFKIVGDSLLANVNIIDTTFIISNKGVLRKYKGYYFLNFGDSTNWTVRKLFLQKGILTINTISTHDEIKNLREITESIADTSSYSFKPTIKQFKRFIKQNGFKDSSIYKKIRE